MDSLLAYGFFLYISWFDQLEKGEGIVACYMRNTQNVYSIVYLLFLIFLLKT